MNTTAGLTLEQLENGTPSVKRIELKAYYKEDKCKISPAKDINGRYYGIVENIPETKKLELGYLPTVESSVRIHDGMTIDLNDTTWRRDWEWMKHCVEIAEDFATGQATPGAFFYIYRPGVESAKKVQSIERVTELNNYIINDSADNLYNRASMLGMDMRGEAITDVKEYLFDMVRTSPKKIAKVYESKTFTIELLLMNAIENKVITKNGGVYVFGEILLGVDKEAVISFLANPKHMSTTKTVESLTYGTKKHSINPLANEIVSYEDKNFSSVDEAAEISAAKSQEEDIAEKIVKPSSLTALKSKSKNRK
jgi:hypothetical protein